MSTISSFCKVICMGCDALELVSECRALRTRSPDEGVSSRVSIIAFNLFSIWFNGAEIHAKWKNIPSKDILKIKESECIVKMFEACFRTGLVLSEENVDLRKFEKLAVAPWTSFVRAGLEVNVLYEKTFLEMTPEELSKAVRHVRIDSSLDDYPIYKEIPVTRQDCEKRYEEGTVQAKRAEIAEAILKSGASSIAIRKVENLYDRIYAWLQRQHSTGRRTGHGPDQGPRERTGPTPSTPGSTPPSHTTGNEKTTEFLDLLALDEIPLPLHDDIVFKKYICPLSKAPIRFPVRDPNGITLYEKKWILNAIATNGKSPVTRLSLRKENLVEVPFLQALINRRLVEHTYFLRKTLLERSKKEITSKIFQEKANQENPKY